MFHTFKYVLFSFCLPPWRFLWLEKYDARQNCWSEKIPRYLTTGKVFKKMPVSVNDIARKPIFLVSEMVCYEMLLCSLFEWINFFLLLLSDFHIRNMDIWRNFPVENSDFMKGKNLYCFFLQVKHSFKHGKHYQMH